MGRRSMKFGKHLKTAPGAPSQACSGTSVGGTCAWGDNLGTTELLHAVARRVGFRALQKTLSALYNSNKVNKTSVSVSISRDLAFCFGAYHATWI